MRILIATGIFPPEIGGPATYAKCLAEEFRRAGHSVRVATYGWERKLPTGLRHLIYLTRSLPQIIWSEKILVLDTFSVGIPIALATLIFPRPFAVRIGGDFVWELYVERTRESEPIPDFYDKNFLAKLNLKERVIFKLTKFMLSRASRVVFTTPWLKEIWVPVYGVNLSSVAIVENTLEHHRGEPHTSKTFLWAGRWKFLKNIERLKMAFEAASAEAPGITLECIQASKEELAKKLSKCYAVILPSLSEVSPNFAHDAISYGKPLIVTKYSGLAADIQGLSLTIDPLSVDDMKEKIIELADDQNYEKMKERLGAFARARAWPAVAEDYIRELENSR